MIIKTSRIINSLEKYEYINNVMHTQSKIMRQTMSFNKFPKHLLGNVWHATTATRFKLIKKNGFIKINPNIPDQDRTGCGNKEKYPLVRTLKGISIFDFRIVDEKYLNDHYSHWNWVLVSGVEYEDIIWISINLDKLKDCFLSGEEVSAIANNSKEYRKYIPKIEGAILCDIPLSSFEDVWGFSHKNKYSWSKL
ncbi:hypothetical protein [Proteus sp. HMSC14B05]|uniref:hypothetical protein n=1 Tax=Proteus sp. HMSC14B05 TaxID=1581097 RepID=UPI0008A24575|nr:hypothetical protein [Proteus sp. HMSC14B05]OFV20274.1 hypothetical protein HMPREF3129_05275 [Proteus sp. HMSC14B05]